MGSTVSSGRDNDELIDNLIDSDLITTKQTENVFRAVDRGNYLLPSHRKAAYQVRQKNQLSPVISHT